ncbi:MAG: rRNA maturation RNase YbeY [Microcystaceae cyanobacterium]
MSSSQSKLILEFNLQDTFFSHASSVHLGAAQTSPVLPTTWESWFQAWLEAMASQLPEADSYELSLRLTDDTEIQTFNAQYRSNNQPTDVLAFAALEVDTPHPLTPGLSSEPLYLGDILISVETASRQAQQHGYSLMTELAWLAAHGFLHLIGWDHPNDRRLMEMLSQQETLLKLVGLVL